MPQIQLPFNSIKLFHFSTLYTVILQSKRIDNLKDLVHLCFFLKRGQIHVQIFGAKEEQTYFVISHFDSNKKYSEADICRLLDFMIGNIFEMWTCFKLCALSLLVVLHLYSYEAYFMQSLLQRKNKKLTQSFCFTLCYIDAVLSLDNINLATVLT